MAVETRTTSALEEPALDLGLAQQLLARHRPVLLWDSQEDFRATAASTIVVNPGNVLEVDGRVVAGVLGEGGNDLSLQLLADGIDGVDFARHARLMQAPFPFATARRLQGVPEYANRVYGRAIHRGARVYLQYWSWLYYNPKNLLGYGRHQGDWELIQVALDATTHQPVMVTYAQHGRGERKAESHVQWINCEPACTPECRHPCVYVAPFSHAGYFESGTHFYFPGTDNPDGSVREELPQIAQFGAWQTWPGRWGRESHPIGPSPESPGRQARQWDPERFEREARDRRPREQRLLWKLGWCTFPAAPEVDTAVLEQDTVVITWRVARRLGWWPLQLGLRPSWSLLTVHDGPGSSGAAL